MLQPGSTLVTLAVAIVFAACGGSDSPSGPGGGNNGGGGGGGTTREIKANPSFASDIREIFSRNGCTASGCHGDGTGGLTLGASAAGDHAMLVGVPSSSEPTFNRVTPNDATNSYLVIKLEGRQTVGARMPRGGSPLDNIDITNVKNWINTGAPNN
jgi:hypothetical protein